MVSERALVLRGRLDGLAVSCLCCRQSWLAPGLAAGESYACKACGAVFAKKASATARPPSDLPTPHRGQGAV